MARRDDGHITRRVAHALQALSRGEADGVEIRGTSLDQEVAQTVVADFLHAFELDFVFTELPYGFLVAVRNPPTRTIQIEL